MGGIGSGGYPDDVSNHRGGRQKTSAVAVAGSGVPQKPDDLIGDESSAWDLLVATTAGVTFHQDSIALAECAKLMVRQAAFHAELRNKPTDESLNRLSLAVGRALDHALQQMGLTPRSRQLLVVPRAGEPEPDEFEKMLRARE